MSGLHPLLCFQGQSSHFFLVSGLFISTASEQMSKDMMWVWKNNYAYSLLDIQGVETSRVTSKVHRSVMFAWIMNNDTGVSSMTTHQAYKQGCNSSVQYWTDSLLFCILFHIHIVWTKGLDDVKHWLNTEQQGSKTYSFFRSLTEADYEIISILALQCLGRRILLFDSVDARSFLQQLSMGDFFWNGLKGPKIHPAPLAATEGGNLRNLNLYSQKSLVSAHSLFLQYFLGNAASHSQSLPHAAITPFLPISVPPAQPALNIRPKTNGLVTLEAAELPCRLWPESWATEGKAMGAQLLTSSAPSILNRAWVPLKWAFLAGGQELTQKLVLPMFWAG